AVVTADTPAVRELLAPDDEVLTVPAADAAALATALAALATDPLRRHRLALAGRAAYDQRFSPPVLGARLRDALVARLTAWPAAHGCAPAGRAGAARCRPCRRT